MHDDFDGYRWWKNEERQNIAVDAQKVANIYKEMIQSVSKELETPHNMPVVDFMGWLAGELAALGDHMMVGQEYVSMILLRAFATSLAECGCDHIDKVEIKGPLPYWNATNFMHNAAKRFF